MTKKLDSVQYSLIKNYLDRSVESVEHVKANGSVFDITDDKLICKTNVTLELKDVLAYADSFSSTQIVTEVNLEDLEIEDIRIAETSNGFSRPIVLRPTMKLESPTSEEKEKIREIENEIHQSIRSNASQIVSIIEGSQLQYDLLLETDLLKNPYHQFKLEILSYQSLDAETIAVKLKYSFGDMQVLDEDEIELCLASGVAIVDVKASKYRTAHSVRYDYTGERSIEIEVDFDRSNEMSQDQINHANYFVEKTIDSYFDSFDIVFGFDSDAFI